MRALDKQIMLRTNQAWLDKIDAWRNAQTFKPDRSELIRRAVDEFIDRQKEGEK